MRRVDRRHIERRRRLIITIGLSFAVGALVDAGLTWRLGEPEKRAAMDPAVAADPEPAHDPAEPRAVERPGEDGLPPPVATTGAVAHETAVRMLHSRDLELPVRGVTPDDLRDTFFDSRGRSRAHEALDIMAPRHTPVRAVDDGVIAKLFTSRAGGTTIYQFDASGTFCFYYAHLERYAPGLAEGQRVERGQTIGYVGSSGNASPEAPHLHFAIFRLTPERVWWKGEPVNPYAVFK